MRKAALVLALLLSGCSFDSKWKDTTGQARGNSSSVQDNKACDEEAGFDPNAAAKLSAEQAQSLWREVRTCMKARGWILVRADNDEPITFGGD